MSRFTLSMIALLGLAACDQDQTTCEARGEDEIQFFLDEDRDGFGNRNSSIISCRDLNGDNPAGYVTDDSDCNDLIPSVYPTAPELCDGLDNNCNLQIDDGLRPVDYWLDEDGDGFGNPSLQIRTCALPEGAAEVAGDCNDGDALVNPDAVEVCDLIDNDCDGLIDDADAQPTAEGGVDLATGLPFYPDADMDGYGSWDPETMVMACEAPMGFTADTTDCDDADPVVNIDNSEVCNGLDDDCDQLYDDSDPDLDPNTRTEYFLDEDADGFGDADTSIFSCTVPWFYSVTDDDCDDGDAAVTTDLLTTWVLDGDDDGFGAGDVSEPGCTPPTADHVPTVLGIDCDDMDPEINPAADEVCDTIDNDCDGDIDDADSSASEGGVLPETQTTFYADSDGDGFGDIELPTLACVVPAGLVDNFTDCDDTNVMIFPGQVEECNGFDDDCDFLVDDADPDRDVDSTTLWVEDADLDGWGNLSVLIRACEQPIGYIDNFGDCDDTDPFIQLATNFWQDSDGDGQGAGPVVGPASCEPPDTDYVPWYVGSLEDCAPEDPTALEGAEICYDGVDQGCDGSDTTADGSCQLLLPETCDEALPFTPIVVNDQQITIVGTLAGTTNDFDPDGVPNCTDGQAQSGDRLVPVRVDAGMTVQVGLRVTGGDSSVYLLSSCDAVESCLAGADNSSLNSSLERVTWTNDGVDDVVVYAVLDGDVFTDARPYTLTIERIEVAN